MVANIGSLNVDFTVNAGPFVSGMALAERVTARTARTISREAGVAQQSVERFTRSTSSSNIRPYGLIAVSRAFERVNDRVSLLRGTMLATTAVFGGFAAALSSNLILRYADSYTNLSNQLRVVSKGSADLAGQLAAVQAVANDSRSSLSSTATLFARLQKAAPGVDNNKILEYVQTIQKALALGGATAQEATSAAIQFSQAVASNRLGGEELRAVLETPLGLALAKGLDVTIGKLREMSIAGELTADKVLGALARVKGEVDAQFSQSVQSIDQALLKADNALTEYVGSLDKTYGLTRLVSGGILGFANNIDVLANSVGGLALVMGAAFGGRLFGRGADKVLGATFGAVTKGAAEAKAQVRELTEAQGEFRKEVERASSALGNIKNRPAAEFNTSSELKMVQREEARLNQLKEKRLGIEKQIADATAASAAVQVKNTAAITNAANRIVDTNAKIAASQQRILDLNQELVANQKRLADANAPFVGRTNADRVAGIAAAEKERIDIQKRIQRENEYIAKQDASLVAQRAAFAEKEGAQIARAAEQKARFNRIIVEGGKQHIAILGEIDKAQTKVFQTRGQVDVLGRLGKDNAISQATTGLLGLQGQLLETTVRLGQTARAAGVLPQIFRVIGVGAKSLGMFLGGGWGVAFTAGTIALALFGRQAAATAASVEKAERDMTARLGDLSKMGGELGKAAEKSLAVTRLDAQIKAAEEEIANYQVNLESRAGEITDLLAEIFAGNRGRLGGKLIGPLVQEIDALASRAATAGFSLEQIGAAVRAIPELQAFPPDVVNQIALAAARLTSVKMAAAEAKKEIAETNRELKTSLGTSKGIAAINEQMAEQRSRDDQSQGLEASRAAAAELLKSMTAISMETAAQTKIREEAAKLMADNSRLQKEEATAAATTSYVLDKIRTSSDEWRTSTAATQGEFAKLLAIAKQFAPEIDFTTRLSKEQLVAVTELLGKQTALAQTEAGRSVFSERQNAILQEQASILAKIRDANKTAFGADADQIRATAEAIVDYQRAADVIQNVDSIMKDLSDDTERFGGVAQSAFAKSATGVESFAAKQAAAVARFADIRQKTDDVANGIDLARDKLSELIATSGQRLFGGLENTSGVRAEILGVAHGILKLRDEFIAGDINATELALGVEKVEAQLKALGVDSGALRPFIADAYTAIAAAAKLNEVMKLLNESPQDAAGRIRALADLPAKVFAQAQAASRASSATFKEMVEDARLLNAVSASQADIEAREAAIRADKVELGGDDLTNAAKMQIVQQAINERSAEWFKTSEATKGSFAEILKSVQQFAPWLKTNRDLTYDQLLAAQDYLKAQRDLAAGEAARVGFSERTSAVLETQKRLIDEIKATNNGNISGFDLKQAKDSAEAIVDFNRAGAALSDLSSIAQTVNTDIAALGAIAGVAYGAAGDAVETFAAKQLDAVQKVASLREAAQLTGVVFQDYRNKLQNLIRDSRQDLFGKLANTSDVRGEVVALGVQILSLADKFTAGELKGEALTVAIADIAKKYQALGANTGALDHFITDLTTLIGKGGEAAQILERVNNALNASRPGTLDRAANVRNAERAGDAKALQAFKARQAAAANLNKLSAHDAEIQKRTLELLEQGTEKTYETARAQAQIDYVQEQINAKGRDWLRSSEATRGAFGAILSAVQKLVPEMFKITGLTAEQKLIYDDIIAAQVKAIQQDTNRLMVGEREAAVLEKQDQLLEKMGKTVGELSSTDLRKLRKDAEKLADFDRAADAVKNIGSRIDDLKSKLQEMGVVATAANSNYVVSLNKTGGALSEYLAKQLAVNAEITRNKTEISDTEKSLESYSTRLAQLLTVTGQKDLFGGLENTAGVRSEIQAVNMTLGALIKRFFEGNVTGKELTTGMDAIGERLKALGADSGALKPFLQTIVNVISKVRSLLEFLGLLKAEQAAIGAVNGKAGQTGTMTTVPTENGGSVRVHKFNRSENDDPEAQGGPIRASVNGINVISYGIEKNVDATNNVIGGLDTLNTTAASGLADVASATRSGFSGLNDTFGKVANGVIGVLTKLVTPAAVTVEPTPPAQTDTVVVPPVPENKEAFAPVGTAIEQLAQSNAAGLATIPASLASVTESSHRVADAILAARPAPVETEPVLVPANDDNGAVVRAINGISVDKTADGLNNIAGAIDSLHGTTAVGFADLASITGAGALAVADGIKLLVGIVSTALAAISQSQAPAPDQNTPSPQTEPKTELVSDPAPVRAVVNGITVLSYGIDKSAEATKAVDSSVDVLNRTAETGLSDLVSVARSGFSALAGSLSGLAGAIISVVSQAAAPRESAPAAEPAPTPAPETPAPAAPPPAGEKEALANAAASVEQMARSSANAVQAMPQAATAMTSAAAATSAAATVVTSAAQQAANALSAWENPGGNPFVLKRGPVSNIDPEEMERRRRFTANRFGGIAGIKTLGKGELPGDSYELRPIYDLSWLDGQEETVVPNIAALTININGNVNDGAEAGRQAAFEIQRTMSGLQSRRTA